LQDPWTAKASPTPFDASLFEASLTLIAAALTDVPFHGQSQLSDRAEVFREYH